MIAIISVIIPTYNRASKLKKSLQSVQLQTFKDWEVIVVDDASCDNTEEMIAQKRDEILNLVYIKNATNKGVSYSRNIGIKHARGKFIAFLDSDDEWYPFHLEESFNVLNETNYQICSTLWDENHYGDKKFVGDFVWFKKLLIKLREELNIDPENILWKFKNNFFEFILKTGFYCFCINTVVVEKQILFDIGLFNEELRINEDMDLLYRIISKYPLVTINRSHFIYNYGDDNLFAFVDRNNDPQSFSIETRERLYQHLSSKISFYQLLHERLTATHDIHKFNKPSEIFNSINYNIVIRCLTIMSYMSNDKNDKRYIYYHRIAKHYANNEELQFYIDNCENEEIFCNHFCLF